MSDDSCPTPRGVIESLVGIYHANGTIFGELSYWIGARFGRTHCSLCSITHGSVREKPRWQACRASLAVPFITVHLDERGGDLIELTDHHTPCVVAHTDSGPMILVTTQQLEACAGSPDQLVETVRAAAASSGLTFF